MYLALKSILLVFTKTNLPIFFEFQFSLRSPQMYSIICSLQFDTYHVRLESNCDPFSSKDSMHKVSDSTVNTVSFSPLAGLLAFLLWAKHAASQKSSLWLRKKRGNQNKTKSSINCSSLYDWLSLLCDKKDILEFHILPPLGLSLDLGFVEGFPGETGNAWTR